MKRAMRPTHKAEDGKGKPATARLGDVVATVFEETMRVTKDPKRAAELASEVLSRILGVDGSRRARELLAAVD